MNQHRNSLNPGHPLHWYVIKKILGQGGFGITYLAEDTNLSQLVAIKEYLPIDMAVRGEDDSVYPVSGEHGEQFSWGLQRFISEARTLAQFKHPHIVRVLTVFEANNTAYMVMEYENGKGLHELLKEQKTLPEKQTLGILLPILDGLKAIHETGFIHRDIKPANIYLREDGSPVLLDFGSARQALGEKTHTLTSMVSPGFAPFEQYVAKSDKQGPWTDIYALGATLFRCAVGRSPAEAMDRSEALLHTNRDSYVSAAEISPQGYSRAFLSAIDHALEFKGENRPQTVEMWRREFALIDNAATQLSEDQDMIPTLAATNAVDTLKISVDADELTRTHETKTSQDREASSHRKILVVIVLLLCVLLAVLFGRNDQQRRTELAPDAIAGLNDINEQAQALEDDIPTLDKPVNKLLLAARADIAALRLSSPQGNNAMEKYQELRAMKNGAPAATEIHGEIVDKYIELSLKAVKENDPNLAELYFKQARALDPTHPEIEEISSILYSSLQLQPKDNTLIAERDKSQLRAIQERLRENPDDKNAKKRLRRLMTSYESRIRDAMQDKDVELAEDYIRQMLKLAPDNKRLNEALKKVQKLKGE